jgi:hypothetical protein
MSSRSDRTSPRHARAALLSACAPQPSKLARKWLGKRRDRSPSLIARNRIREADTGKMRLPTLEEVRMICTEARTYVYV